MQAPRLAMMVEQTIIATKSSPEEEALALVMVLARLGEVFNLSDKEHERFARAVKPILRYAAQRSQGEPEEERRPLTTQQVALTEQLIKTARIQNKIRERDGKDDHPLVEAAGQMLAEARVAISKSDESVLNEVRRRSTLYAVK